MIRGIFSAKAIVAGVFKGWNVAVLLGASLFLAVACTTAVPAATKTITPPPSDTPTPVQQPAPGVDEGTNTPEPEASSRRPPPNNDDRVARRIRDTPDLEAIQLLPNNTLALVMAVKGGSSSSTLKTLVSDPGSGQVTGTKFIQLESSSKSVVLYLPGSGESTVMSSYTSPSYAPHFKRWMTASTYPINTLAAAQ